jgi:hypothetical protein
MAKCRSRSRNITKCRALGNNNGGSRDMTKDRKGRNSSRLRHIVRNILDSKFSKDIPEFGQEELHTDSDV